ncbi:MAG: formate--tetrahydrofolate ligase [Acetomicrobium sp.]|jgi:formate--tetrahydrofolate ligase|uniref:formate--tetrahydrofolate ligase n=1 Tax=Acetomicrobium TaxID=49894 RepID=UPI0026F35464|nr:MULTISPECIES: formate--tetrahydrofolate ligase [Acetomicrobium]MDI9377530.1 formate--tetrahydrofolate ligase [Synergistota bacterium]MDR9770937.1 formate--tetrahydrofolate ligase [Acetomicrobium sp.]HOB10077.1 formate--tetrahydrofolate ligase [Acetomicrobium sp.]HQA35779.1 formate--tetrahydrofolate ligase [Acetomicrobium sp.]HQC87517.1 formate--tetrahydrofolate ligase [Acetomicrobium sp.]
MLSDIEIARNANLKHISEIARELEIPDEYLFPYGHYKAKVDINFFKELENRPDGKLVLVTATTPTPAGEGKTTITVGLTEALVKLGKKAMLCLREPSLGPCFGVKGGAAGGGYSQVLPMEEINLHFTGDIHAVESAHNLLAAMLDNHLHQGNDLGIDPREVTWRRAMDMNERALRNIVVGLGGRTNGVPRETGFDITVASEIMAILCLSENLADLKERLSKVIVGYTTKGKVVKAGDLKAQGAMAALLKEAINPNLVQTVKHVPAFVHGGPFANIAHGTNSIVATRMALKLRDYAIVEAGFASDLGAEKFFDIVCRLSGLSPSAVVLVTTVRSLKHHGGVKKEELSKENLDALSSGISNLEAHLDILSNFGLPVVVALNKFNTDTKEELDMVMEAAKKRNARIALSEVWEKGGEGGIDLAKEVLEAIGEGKTYRTLYDLDMSLKEKIKTIATRIYGADDVEYVPQALAMLEDLEQRGFGSLPVCMAKTQLSLSDDPKKLGRPKDYRVTVREVRLSAGAGFVVAICGSIMTMPGLPKKPAAESIDIDEKGNITGLF